MHGPCRAPGDSQRAENPWNSARIPQVALGQPK
jgi:hypothetical protein